MVITRIRTAALAGLMALGAASAAHAQARVFVASTGNDVFACTATHPCRTFQRAHNVVSAGGEIVALDSGAYGPVNITKSVTINTPDGVYAGSTGIMFAITVNGTGINVELHGLSIYNPDGGVVGVLVAQANLVTVDHCNISGFNDAAVENDSNGTVVVQHTRVLGNDTAHGVWAPAFSGGGKGKIVVDDMRVERVYAEAVRIEVGTASVRNLVAVANGGGVSAKNQGVTVNVLDSLIANNSGNGVQSDGALVRIAHSRILDNNKGLDIIGGGNICNSTPLDNLIEGNALGDGSPFTCTAPGK
jgi:hypothetical protein